MTTLKVLHKFDLDQFVLSDYGLKQYDHFGMLHLYSSDLLRTDDDQQFFIVAADPEHNYGLDFIIYTRYKADGIWFFGKFSHTSSLNSYPFRIATSMLFLDMTIEQQRLLIGDKLITEDKFNSIVIADEGFGRDNGSRRFFRDRSDYLTITTSF